MMSVSAILTAWLGTLLINIHLKIIAIDLFCYVCCEAVCAPSQGCRVEYYKTQFFHKYDVTKKFLYLRGGD